MFNVQSFKDADLLQRNSFFSDKLKFIKYKFCLQMKHNSKVFFLIDKAEIMHTYRGLLFALGVQRKQFE